LAARALAYAFRVPYAPTTTMNTPVRTLLFASSLLCLSAAPVIAETGDGAKLAYTCTACHGRYGQKQAPGQPVIGGRDYFELLAAMASFRGTERIHPAMSVMMLSLDEVEMAEIAEYFANVDPARLERAGPYGER
jgi:cytochrome c553